VLSTSLGNDYSPIALPPLTSNPLVSVVVANYNYGRYLREMVESLLAQTYPNWELLICDDGSTDGSQDILVTLGRLDSRVRPLFKANGGQASAWNFAVRCAKGDIICLLDADDWFKPEKLETIVQAFRQNPRVGLVYHPLQRTNEFGVPVGQPIPEDLPNGWLFDVAVGNGGHAFLGITSSLSLRAEVVRQLFPIPEVFRRGYGDSFISRTAVFLTEVAAIPCALAYYRRHPNSCSGSDDPFDAQAFHNKVVEVFAGFPHEQRIISHACGPSIAAQVKLDDFRWLWETMARLYILHGKPVEGIEGITAEEMLLKMPPLRRRAWSLVFNLPSGVARHVLRLWHALSPIRRLLRLPVRFRHQLRPLLMRTVRCESYS
jgi:glycosyltransferase involved in cell wall biosynthesis